MYPTTDRANRYSLGLLQILQGVVLSHQKIYFLDRNSTYYKLIPALQYLLRPI